MLHYRSKHRDFGQCFGSVASSKKRVVGTSYRKMPTGLGLGPRTPPMTSIEKLTESTKLLQYNCRETKAIRVTLIPANGYDAKPTFSMKAQGMLLESRDAHFP